MLLFQFQLVCDYSFVIVKGEKKLICSYVLYPKILFIGSLIEYLIEIHLKKTENLHTRIKMCLPSLYKDFALSRNISIP